MSQYKAVEVRYVAPTGKERSGIGQDVPAHVILQWRDKEGRKNTLQLDLSPEEVTKIAELPDGLPDCSMGRAQHNWARNFAEGQSYCTRCGEVCK